VLDSSVDPPVTAALSAAGSPTVEKGDWRGNNHSLKPCLHIPRVEGKTHRLTTLVLKVSPALCCGGAPAAGVAAVVVAWRPVELAGQG
jgi:hypothetical protein